MAQDASSLSSCPSAASWAVALACCPWHTSPAGTALGCRTGTAAGKCAATGRAALSEGAGAGARPGGLGAQQAQDPAGRAKVVAMLPCQPERPQQQLLLRKR